jgi:hypothetical protein
MAVSTRSNPWRIIVAPVCVASARSNFVVESSGNLVARRRLRAEAATGKKWCRSEMLSPAIHLILGETMHSLDLR